MASTFDSQSYTIGTLIGDSERRSIVLPRFQRGYSWETSHVLAFWDDLFAFLERFEKEPIAASYFLGPVVIQNTKTEIILLDGQQRLATATILLAALRDYARTLDKEGEFVGADEARDIQRKFIEKDDTEPIQYSIQLSELDNAYFKQNIQQDPPDLASKPRLRSHKLINNAYNNLKDKISEYIPGPDAKATVRKIKKIRDCLTKGMLLIAIQVDSEEDAFSIFATLNDRGLRLSVPDLLLNLLMQRAETDDQRSAVREQWNYMLQAMGTRDISRFLRHMWLSRYGDLKARSLFTEMKVHLQNNEITSLSFADQCAKECDNYISLLDIDNEINQEARNSLEGIIKNLSVLTSLPLLLSGLTCLNESDFAKLCDYVAGLVVRYYLVANLNPMDLETSFYKAAREIRGKHFTGEKSAHCLLAAKTILAKINPSDSTVKERGKNLELKRKQATWLVKNIAQGMQTKTKEIAFDKANLEHIFPENAGADWPNRKELEPFIWHIGNLTHLGKRMNNKASNKGFKEKCRAHYAKSEIVMTQKISDYEVWTPTEINNRSIELVEQIVRIWPGP